ncbi:MAG: histidine kinase dimerization/phospho-acceptor domain-containing protein [Chthoniobacterales bacterium]
MTRKTKSEKRPPPERPWPPLSLHQFDLATLSHELRTPLNAMFGWTQLMKSGRHEPELISEGIEVIDRNVRVQTDLIEDLLDMSRVISG